MKKYWLTLHPYTFLWIKEDKCFIYQSINYKKAVILLKDEKIKDISHQLLITNNLYTVELSEENLKEKEFEQWINAIINIDAGYITVNDGLNKKPISLRPILKIQNNVDVYILQHNKGTNGDIIHNLHEITFYINRSDYGSNSWYCQTVFPLKECDELDIKEIVKFIDNATSSFLHNINIVGNVFSYSNFDVLFEYMSKSQIKFTINIAFSDFEENIKRIISTEWSDNICFNILIDSMHKFTIIPLENVSAYVLVTILVYTETGYVDIIDCFENRQIYCNAKMIPIYNGINIEFFENNVYMNRNDFEEVSLSKREIFIHQSLNINDFGKLTIMPNGKVYGNINIEPLGTIHDTLCSLIYKEFTEGKSWLRIRDQKPCVDCIYQWLCPSPSNYEIVIGRPNLCSIVN